MARNAQTALLSRLGKPRWLRGIGIAAGAVPKLRVDVEYSNPEVRASVPRTIDGVAIEVRVVGKITAAPARPAGSVPGRYDRDLLAKLDKSGR